MWVDAVPCICVADWAGIREEQGEDAQDVQRRPEVVTRDFRSKVLDLQQPFRYTRSAILVS